MSHGPDPWHQTAWDWRAAGNFIGGGAGAGLIVFAALAQALGGTATLPFACGVALVGAGLVCVWLEIGRPLRALHVFFNPRRSWMSREAIVATLLLPLSLGAALGIAGCAAAAALLALAFLYSQARIVRAAQGIPAWRAPQVVPLLVATALAEGAGLFLVFSALHGGLAAPMLAGPTGMLLALAGLLVLARWAAWLAYRRALALRPTRAMAVLDAAARPLQWAGTLGPLALLALATGSALALGLTQVATIAPSLAASLAAAPLAAGAIAGLGMIATGAWLKYVLVTRAAFNQGFALARLPVRGVVHHAAATPPGAKTS